MEGPAGDRHFALTVNTGDGSWLDVAELSVVDTANLDNVFSTSVQLDVEPPGAGSPTEAEALAQSQGAPDFAQAWAQLVGFVTQHAQGATRVVLVVHDGVFPLLLHNFRRYGVALPQGWHYLDTTQMAEALGFEESAHAPFWLSMLLHCCCVLLLQNWPWVVATPGRPLGLRTGLPCATGSSQRNA